MDNAFWNTLTVEMSEFVYQMEVLKQYRAISANCEGCSVVCDRGSVRCSQSVVWWRHFFFFQSGEINVAQKLDEHIGRFYSQGY